MGKTGNTIRTHDSLAGYFENRIITLLDTISEYQLQRT